MGKIKRRISAMIGVFLFVLSGCQSAGNGNDAEAGSAVKGVSLLTQLAGLWAGAASTTPLGPIPVMNMDFRAVSPHVLFGRVDLDDMNSLRFDFSVEAPNQDGPPQPALIFRNGGYFLGILRDSRTELLEYSSQGPTYRFCALNGGCDYIDARWNFTDATHFLLDVKVRKMQHVLWSPVRKETRDLPSPFPADELPHGPADASWPAMPRLLLAVTWADPLPGDADILVVLSTTSCNYLLPGDLGCTISRSLLGQGSAGAKSATLVFEQIHAGDYKATVILDRHGMLKQRLFPQSGDGISLPNQALTILPSGDSLATIPVPLTIP